MAGLGVKKVSPRTEKGAKPCARQRANATPPNSCSRYRYTTRCCPTGKDRERPGTMRLKNGRPEKVRRTDRRLTPFFGASWVHSIANAEKVR